MGIRTVAVYSDADAAALHVAACDEAYRLGPRAAARELPRRRRRSSPSPSAAGAQAIHPGYGFLSENEAFAAAVAAAGLAFVGPPPAAIRAMGSKAEAKTIMGRGRRADRSRLPRRRTRTRRCCSRKPRRSATRC